MSTTVSRIRLAEFLVVLGGSAALVLIGTATLGVSPLAIGPLYMATPLLAGVIVCRRHGITLAAVGLRRGRLRWSLVGALCWPPIVLLIAAISLVLPGVRFDSTMLTDTVGVPATPGWLFVGLLALVGAMILAGVTINAVIAFGEEFGWRGYLLWELAPLGFWRASITIGTIWGLWHVPLVVVGLNYPSFPIVGAILFTVVCIAISPLFTYLVVRGRSVLPATVLHGVINATGLVALAGTSDPVVRELIASEGGAVGLFVFAVGWVLMWTVGVPSLSRTYEPATDHRSDGHRPLVVE